MQPCIYVIATAIVSAQRTAQHMLVYVREHVWV